jgi:hypothetical protein
MITPKKPDFIDVEVGLNLMDPIRSGRRSLLWRGKARQDEHGVLN